MPTLAQTCVDKPACACRTHTTISWIAQIIAAVILAQTLFFKLTYAPETQWIFADLGGRPAATVAALVELAAVIFLLWPGKAWLGAILALGTMAGAIMTHLTMIGIAVTNPATGESDGGLLFALALVVTAAAATVLLLRRDELFAALRRLRPRAA